MKFHLIVVGITILGATLPVMHNPDYFMVATAVVGWWAVGYISGVMTEKTS